MNMFAVCEAIISSWYSHRKTKKGQLSRRRGCSIHNTM